MTGGTGLMGRTRSSFGPNLHRSAVAVTIVAILIAGVLLGGSPAARGPGAPAASVSRLPSSVSAGGLPNPHAAPTVPPPSTEPTWINVTSADPNATPPGAADVASAFDVADDEVVAFGGCTAAVCPDNYTWVFSNGGWTNITDPFDAPPAVEGASMDYDANMGGALLFGGENGSTYLGTTWLFTGGTWTNLTSIGPGPAPRAFASMAFDPDPEVNGSLLFGGCGASCYNDTWAWESWSGWVPLSSGAAPPATSGMAMAFDPVSDYMVLFGGSYGCGLLCVGFYNQTWEFYGGEWWLVHPSGPTPPGRVDAGMVWDSQISALLMFGGSYGFLGILAINETWTFAADSWSNLTGTLGDEPPAISSPAFVPASDGGPPIAFGGVSLTLGYSSWTWVFEIPPAVSLTSASTTGETTEPIAFHLTVTGGGGPFDLALAFGDGGSAAASGPGPTFTFEHAYGAPGSYTPSANVSDAAGASATASAAAISVTAGPAIAASAAPSAGDVGLPIEFQGSVVSPGAPPLAYVWSFGDGSNGSGANLSHRYSAPGTYLVTVNASDAVFATANASVTVVVAPTPTAAIEVAPTTPNTSAPASLFAAVTGGTGPFTYSWIFGDGSSSTLPSPTHQYNSSGTYVVSVWANDSVGGSAHASLSVTVHSGTSAAPAGTLGGFPAWFWAGVGALAVIAVLGSVVLLRRSRGSGR